MKNGKMTKKRGVLILAAVFFLFPVLAWGQGTPRGEAMDDEAYRLKETEIKGELKEVMGNMRLLESKIIGSIDRPSLSYSLPWQDVFLPVGPENNLEGDLLGDSYPFVDPESLNE